MSLRHISTIDTVPGTDVVMQVSSPPWRPHPEYIANFDRWTLCRDVRAGEDIVHLNTTRYLPKLSGQDDDQYKAYLARATFYNAFDRTVEGLAGMLFRREPIIKLPPRTEAVAEDITLAGQTLIDMAQFTVEEVLTLNRGAILVDMPRTATGEVKTVADVARENLRPKWIFYSAEDVISWWTEPVGNVSKLVRILLRERYEIPNNLEGSFDAARLPTVNTAGGGALVADVVPLVQPDEKDERGNQVRIKTQYRSLRLVPEGGGMVYKQRLYNNSGTPITDEMTVIVNNSTIDFIPLFPMAAQNKNWTTQKPLLLDLANLNISHYQITADYRHGLHHVAFPQKWLFGINDKEKPTTTGGNSLWTSTNPEARAGILEFNGQGLREYRDALKAIEVQMTTVGARVLASEVVSRVTATASALRQMGETSILSALSNSISGQMKSALQFTARWLAENPEEVDFRLNRDFFPVPMQANDVIALVKSWQDKAISYDTLVENLKRGERLQMNRTPEEERELIADDLEARGDEIDELVNKKQLEQQEVIAAANANRNEGVNPRAPSNDPTQNAPRPRQPVNAPNTND